MSDVEEIRNWFRQSAPTRGPVPVAMRHVGDLLLALDRALAERDEAKRAVAVLLRERVPFQLDPGAAHDPGAHDLTVLRYAALVHAAKALRDDPKDPFAAREKLFKGARRTGEDMNIDLEPNDLDTILTSLNLTHDTCRLAAEKDPDPELRAVSLKLASECERVREKLVKEVRS